MRIDAFVMMPIFSFANAVTVYTGQNMGIKNIDRIKLGIRQCSIMSLIVSFVMVSLILIFGQYIALAFSSTQEVIDLAIRMLFILGGGYVVLSYNMIVWGVIRGAGDAMSPLVGSILNSVIVRVPTAFLFVHLMGRPEALMYSLLAGWIFNLLIAIVVYRMGKWRTKGITNKALAVGEGVPANESV